ncbi:Calx-beta domain-containing protein [Microbacterium cremeum]|uniref:Calx-beta domain-containing protein n=1 Tax=Microbacterium cremeum TaxID=2782169 RepID=UPI001886B9B9|nr:PKD domain-containing protein [Microbacterium cremeum]
MYARSTTRVSLTRTLGLLLAVLLGITAQPFAARANPADLLYFGDGEPMITAGANGGIYASGAISNVPLCLFGGTNDWAFPAARIYVVAAGSAQDGARMTQADGTEPAVVIGTGSTGAFIDELLAVTGPQGALTEGVYDVVIDNCQDGFYNAGVDSVYGGVITVRYPAVLPPYATWIGEMKDRANQLGRMWLYSNYLARALQALSSYEAPIAWLDHLWQSRGSILDAINDVKFETKVIRFPSGGPWATFQSAINYAASQSDHYKAIAEDPPDHDFQHSTAIPKIETPVADAAYGPWAAVQGIASEAATEGGVAAAYLRSLERYQGATVAGDPEWALRHARELRDLSLTLAGAAERSAEAMDVARASLDQMPAYDQRSRRLMEWASGVGTSSWTPAELRTLANLGVTPEEQDAIRQRLAETGHMLATDSWDLARMDDHYREHAALQRGTAQELRTSAGQLDETIAGLEAQAAVPKTAPRAHAGGPYVVAAGEVVTLDGSASAPGEGGGIASYAWDTDADGEFDDASGRLAEMAIGPDNPGVVSLRVTDAEGREATSYAPLAVDRGAGPEVGLIDGQHVDAFVGDELTVAPEVEGNGAGLTVSWTLEGREIGGGLPLVYTPTEADLGVRGLDLRVTDALGRTTTVRWYLTVMRPDADDDGWSATADCDDDDALRHPGRTEVVGNRIDDDCNDGTLDAPHGAMPGLPVSWSTASSPDHAAVGRSISAALPADRPHAIDLLDHTTRRIIAGDRMGLALTEEGALWSWGRSDGDQLGNGASGERFQPGPVVGLSGTGQLGATGPRVTHADTNRIGVAVLDDGTVASWGPNAGGALGTGNEAASSRVPALVRAGADLLGGVTDAVSAGGFAAFVADGDLWVTAGACGTSGGEDPASRPRTAAKVEDLPAGVERIGAGEGHLLIALQDGSLFGCGDNRQGQLGEGEGSIGSPVRIELEIGSGEDLERAERPARLAAGDGFSLVLDAADRLWTLGAGDPQSRLVELPEGAVVAHLEAGGERAAAVRADGSMVEWAVASGSPTVTEMPAGTLVNSVSLGRDGELRFAVTTQGQATLAWGHPFETRHEGWPAHMSTPYVTDLPAYTDIVTNANNATAAISPDGRVWSWGRIEFRGDAPPAPWYTSTPGPVVGVDGQPGTQLRAKKFAQSGEDSMSFMGAVLDGGQVAVWGSSGHAGAGTIGGVRRYPTLVRTPDGTAPLSGVRQAGLGLNVNLVLMEDGSVMNWGAGQCSTSGYEPLPRRVEGFGTDNRKVAVTREASFVVKRDGSLYSCGRVGTGRPTGEDTYDIEQVPGMGPGSVVDIATSIAGTVVLKADGTLWAWGQDGTCQLGCTEGQSPQQSFRATPEQIRLPEGPPVVSIHTSGGIGFAIREDGSVLAWGRNSDDLGIPGAPGVVATPTPVPMPGDRPISKIVGGYAGLHYHHYLALAGDPVARLAEQRGPGIEVSVADAAVAEGETARLEVTLNHPAGIDYQLAFQTFDGSAIAGTDYESAASSVVIPAGQTGVVIEVPTIDNAMTQSGVERSFEVRLSDAPAWAGISDASASVSIADNDPVPAVGIAGPGSVVEGSAGGREASFTVTLDRPSAAAASVLWRTEDGTAHAGGAVSVAGDYIAGSGVAEFAPGETSKTFSVVVNGDAELEPDETFSIALSDPRGAESGGVTEITIADDEPLLVKTSDQTVIAPAPGEAEVTASFTISAPQLLPGETLSVPWSVSAPWQGSGSAPPGISGSGTVELTADARAAVVVVTVAAGDPQPRLFRLDVSGASSSSGRAVIAEHGSGTVNPADSPIPDPLALITGPSEVQEGSSATFSAADSTGSGQLAYAWDLDGDGETDDADTENAQVNFPVFGSRVILLRVTDDRGMQATTSRLVTVRNVPPAIAALEDVTLGSDGQLRVAGAFVDPGANEWTATVDYGDGEGAQALPLNGQAFALDHVYRTPGARTITVQVCDTGRACGSGSFTVTVDAPPPVLSGIDPIRGPEGGGTRVALTGAHLFTPPGTLGEAAEFPTVLFDGSAATDVTCSRTPSGPEEEPRDLCLATTPAHAPGAVEVTLTVAGGSSATLPDAFTYTGRTDPDPTDPGPGNPGPAVPAEPGSGNPPGTSAQQPRELSETGTGLPPWLPAIAMLLLFAGSVAFALRRRPVRREHQ